VESPRRLANSAVMFVRSDRHLIVLAQTRKIGKTTEKWKNLFELPRGAYVFLLK